MVSKAAQKRAAKREETRREFRRLHPRYNPETQPDDILVEVEGASLTLRPFQRARGRGGWARFQILRRNTNEYLGIFVVGPLGTQPEYRPGPRVLHGDILLDERSCEKMADIIRQRDSQAV